MRMCWMFFPMPYGNEFDITIARTISVTMEARLSGFSSTALASKRSAARYLENSKGWSKGAEVTGSGFLRTHEGTTYISGERG